MLTRFRVTWPRTGEAVMSRHLRAFYRLSLGPGTANWVFSFVNVHETTRTTDSQLTQDLWESSVINLVSLASRLS